MSYVIKYLANNSQKQTGKGNGLAFLTIKRAKEALANERDTFSK